MCERSILSASVTDWLWYIQYRTRPPQDGLPWQWGVLGMLTVILNEFWLPHLTISSWTWFAGKNTTRHNQHLLISTQTNYREVKPKESLIRQYMSVWPTYRGGGWRLICRVIVAHCKTASQYSIICDSLIVEFLLMIHIK